MESASLNQTWRISFGLEIMTVHANETDPAKAGEDRSEVKFLVLGSPQ
jgi:hypothetical protein